VKNAIIYKHKCFILIIGDLKTPDEKNKQIAKEATDYGVETFYMGIDDQEKWLNSFPSLKKIIPYNSDNRRNIGLLMAREMGADIIISIDDDNYCPDEDFFGLHQVVGQTVLLPSAKSDNNWFNPCILLEVEPPITIYPRGFPFSKMWKDNSRIESKEQGYIALNLGLWTESPDLSAITNLAVPIRSRGIKQIYRSTNHVLVKSGLWMPINSQNTAFLSKALPCMYYVRMGYQLNGLTIDRYGDIWQGYFAKKAFDTLHLSISLGLPLTKHIRNYHNLLDDLKYEFWGILLTERLAEWLQSIELEGNDFYTVYSDLAQKLMKVKLFDNSNITRYFIKIASCMNIWLQACSKIL
jgi:hypothetical protein